MPKWIQGRTGKIVRPVYAQVPLPVHELLLEMKRKYEKTYSELVSQALIETYGAEATLELQKSLNEVTPRNR